MRRRSFVVVVASGVAATLLTACTTGGTSHHSAGPSATNLPSAPPPPLTVARARQFSTDLASGKRSVLADVIALPSGVPLLRSAADGLRALAPIRFNVASYRFTGSDTATVRASTAHGPFVVDLVRVGPRWLISATEPVR